MCTLYLILSLNTVLGTYAFQDKTITLWEMSPEMIEDSKRLDLCPKCNAAHAVICRTFAVVHLTKQLSYHADTRLGHCVCFFINDLRTTE